MKAMILAAGRGERLKPFTDHTPKPLLPVYSKPIIIHTIEKLAAIGVKEIVINTSHLAEQFPETLGDGKKFGVKIHYSYEPNVLETGGGIFQALPLLGDKPFIVISGDIYTDYPLENLLSRSLHLVLVNNPDFKTAGDFALTPDGYVENTPPDYTYASLGVLHPTLFADCQPGKFSVVPLLRNAANKHQITGEIYRGTWFNVGTQEELEKLR